MHYCRQESKCALPTGLPLSQVSPTSRAAGEQTPTQAIIPRGEKPASREAKALAFLSAEKEGLCWEEEAPQLREASKHRDEALLGAAGNDAKGNRLLGAGKAERRREAERRAARSRLLIGADAVWQPLIG